MIIIFLIINIINISLYTINTKLVQRLFTFLFILIAIIIILTIIILFINQLF